MVRLDLGFASFEKFDSRVDKKCAKNIDQPVEAINQSDPSEDKKGSKKKGADNSPEESRKLRFFGHGEVTQEHGKDEYVVDA